MTVLLLPFLKLSCSEKTPKLPPESLVWRHFLLTLYMFYLHHLLLVWNGPLQISEYLLNTHFRDGKAM